MDRILDAIDIITTEMDYIYEAIKKIDNSVPAKAQAIAEVVKEREKTNRKLIAFYEQILDLDGWEDEDFD